MFNPVTTYRLQFHKGFTFQDLKKTIPYLKNLGISTIYASPIFQSTPGSTHGYDSLDPNVINPEIGTLDELKEIRSLLAKENIGWLQDIVPNHMAFDTRNPCLKDVLEKGKNSPYADFFDIDWHSTVYTGKLMAPFLGSTLEQVIENGELELVLHGERLVFKYYNALYPANHAAYKAVLENLEQENTTIVQAILNLTKLGAEYSQRFDEFKLSFAEVLGVNQIKKKIEQNLLHINNSKQVLHKLIGEQHYHLCHWQETDKQINYRRFFTVNGLICLNIQNEKVFQHFHELVKKLTDHGIINGLRVDHIDGLLDPTQYLERLKALAGEHVYITIEKILQPGENIPDWKIEGNTGYDFLAIVNNLFTNKKNEKQLNEFYNELAFSSSSFKQQLREKKRYILYQHMSGELENLYQLFLSLNLIKTNSLKKIDGEELKNTIGEFLIYCPVYRFYANAFPLPANEIQSIGTILKEMQKASPDLFRSISILSSVFLQPYDEDEQKKRAVYFYQRCMQFSGPLMAKGLEDTLMYTFNRFIAHNDVGDSPAAFGYTVDEFHDKMKERQKRFPFSMNTTSTHDTKRGEDVRARLNVLSDISDQWIEKTKEWIQLNQKQKKDGIPGANEEYFIYQSMAGHYPVPGQGENENFNERLQEYLQKALREAKTHSGWASPNEKYEKTTKNFAAALLNKEQPFWKGFLSLQNDIVDHGIINSLIQVLLKFTCPGIPDVYQGTELWDLSFVDPDNRRAVDFDERNKILEQLKENESRKDFIESLWKERYSGKIKLWLTHYLLQLRKQHPLLFSEGEYIPLSIKGKWSNHIIAFARKERQTIFIIAASLHLAELCSIQITEWTDIDWADTTIVLPEEILPAGENILYREKFSFSTNLAVQGIFKQMPFAILKGGLSPNKRSAGILLHISSLPSAFGIGDLGHEAKLFADFLHRSYQKYWQLLPLNPTEEGQGHSPYSSTSSSAGNILFISPEKLAQDGFLKKEDLQNYYLPFSNKVDYAAAEKVKKKLLHDAWEIFRKTAEPSLHEDFKNFCKEEKNWLDDFSLFTILKAEHGGKPWFEWPDKFKFRESKALKTILEKFADQYEENKWLQFIFSKQWNDLKDYCNNLHIEFIGDMPFYVSYDSADVWANPEIFKLDAQGNRVGVAGVPPDAFSEDGQLWGMPVFRWGLLKRNNYSWWMERLKKNIELFDIIRLDHFRAFSAYWEVAATEKTAKKGKWKKGPGSHFFKQIKETFGELPFIAEDLGEIDKPVYQLRDQFGLPGMKVLQFAFGDDMGSSIHIPHNYTHNFFVYTGTHDNNTTLGWWKKEAGHDRVEEYSGVKLTDDKIAVHLCRIAYASIARVAVLPIQDVLGLDETARMNMPSSGENNWQWRLLPNQVSADVEKRLKTWTDIYNRR